MTPPDVDVEPQALPGPAVAAAIFVLVAVGLEVLGSQFANSRVPDAGRVVVPLAWPQPVRVLWWLVVAGAATLYRLAECQAGIRRNPVVIASSIVPFVVFAFGIAAGAGFSTWH